MKTICFLVFMVPTLVLAQNSFPQPTYAQYQLHRASTNGTPLPLDHWIDGYLAATLGRAFGDQLDGKIPEFCPPNGQIVRQGIYDSIDRYADYYAKKVAAVSRDMPLAAVITRALIHAYPCRAPARAM